MLLLHCKMASLYLNISDNEWPIVYHKKYNVSFYGLEKFHLFDTHKWGNVIKLLKEADMISDDKLVEPLEAQDDDLLLVHSKKYIKSLNCSLVVAGIAEVPCIAFVPNILVQSKFLKSMRLQTGGSILAGKLALQRGWAINVGGGFHHCSAKKGGGFCFYADITLLIRNLVIHRLIQTAMIVDLDAHQGNGHERDFLNDPNVYIFDMFNQNIYPHDYPARAGIRRAVHLVNKMEDLDYMLKLRTNLIAAFNEFTPDIVVYNAGTDILDKDKLGRLRISQLAVIKRDEFVFSTCRSKRVPIVMLLSGGYTPQSAHVIANSIVNLREVGLIGPKYETFRECTGPEVDF